MDDRWVRLENLLDRIGAGVHTGEKVAFRGTPGARAASDFTIGVGKTGEDGLGAPLPAGVTAVRRVVNGIRDTDERATQVLWRAFHEKRARHNPGGTRSTSQTRGWPGGLVTSAGNGT